MLLSQREVEYPIVVPTPRGNSLRWPTSPRANTELYKQTPVFEEGLCLSNENVIPYRLPKLPTQVCTSRSQEQDPDKLWSQYGYEDIIRSVRGSNATMNVIPAEMPELSPTINRMIVPPRILAQQYRQSNMMVPKFRHAAIAPAVSKSCPQWPLKEAADNLADTPKRRSSTVAGHFEPIPTPVTRAVSPAKSMKSIHWALGNQKHTSFDRKGRGRKQGPYSREFTVTCMAPPNWLKMKLGRSKTMTSM